jgi:hypothetical protein
MDVIIGHEIAEATDHHIKQQVKKQEPFMVTYFFPLNKVYNQG